MGPVCRPAVAAGPAYVAELAYVAVPSIEKTNVSVRSGILEDGPRDRSRITSYLGRAKAMFDNVRGEGYGLREWRTPSG